MALSKTQRLNLKAPHQVLSVVKVSPLEVKLVASSENKAAMIIPKRFVSLAHDRNYLRRSCLELVRRAFKKRKIGGIILRVYRCPNDLQKVSAVLDNCLEQLRS